jgi:hypothetical protein
MKNTTRLRIARAVNFLRPRPAKIPLSVEDILSDRASSGVVDQFNKLYYESGVAGILNWRGIQVLKNPCDLWMMLELLQTERADRNRDAFRRLSAAILRDHVAARNACHNCYDRYQPKVDGRPQPVSD